MRELLRYLFRGDCGLGCDYAWLRDDKTAVRLWIPEACCPVHDPEVRWQRWLSRPLLWLHGPREAQERR